MSDQGANVLQDMVLTYESLDETLTCNYVIKTTGQWLHFIVVTILQVH